MGCKTVTEWKEDKYLSTIDSSIKKWMNIPVPFEIFDTRHTPTPTFLSVTRKESLESFLRVIDGHECNSAENELNGLFVQGIVGDNTRGGGHSYAGEEGISDDPDGLRKVINNGFDSVLKVAVSSYIDRAQTLLTLRESQFVNLSKEPVVEYLEDMKNGSRIIMPTNEEVKKFEDISKKFFNMPHVETSKVIVNSRVMRRWFGNSEGTKIRTKTLRGNAVWVITVRNTKGAHRFIIDTYRYTKKGGWSNAFNIENKADEISKKINRLYNAPALESGVYPVIMDHSAFGTFFHEAIAAHLLSGEYIAAKEANTFANQIGKQVMPSFLTVKMEPKLRGGYGSFKYDEDGVESKNVTLVKDGVLQTYILDRQSAAALKLPNNGHARVEWIINDEDKPQRPAPRVSNLRIESNMKFSEEQLVDKMRADCEKNGLEFGLYIKSGAGHVDIEEGTFVLDPDEIWAIHTDGKRRLLSGAKVIENPHNLLNSIAACSNVYRTKHGLCGSESGWVTTQEIAPSAYFPRVNFQKETDVELADRLVENIKNF